MNNSGYSNASLVKKLGYMPTDSIYTKNAPDWYTKYLTSLGYVPSNVMSADWAHIFFDNHKQLIDFCEGSDLSQIGKALWVSWPKKASGVITDITEQSFRETILPLGWVDIKVVAIDQTWSGLKFTRRNK